MRCANLNTVALAQFPNPIESRTCSNSLFGANMGIRWHIDEDLRVKCARFMGLISGATGLRAIRQHHVQYPATINYGQIQDMRCWSGFVTDDDLIAQFRWLTEFRRKRGLAATPMPKIVYLSPPSNGITSISDSVKNPRGTSIHCTSSLADAWSMVAPGITMPASVKKFFSSRS